MPRVRLHPHPHAPLSTRFQRKPLELVLHLTRCVIHALFETAVKLILCDSAGSQRYLLLDWPSTCARKRLKTFLKPAAIMNYHLLVRAAMISIETKCSLLPMYRPFAQRTEVLLCLTPSAARNRQAHAPKIWMPPCRHCNTSQGSCDVELSGVPNIIRASRWLQSRPHPFCKQRLVLPVFFLGARTVVSNHTQHRTHNYVSPLMAGPCQPVD
jgi:hypothetical protein